MFSATRLKKEFWTVFGQYMKPVPFAEGEKNNWLNYKTGVKNIAFKTDADNKQATIAIELTHADKGLQELYYQQLEELKIVFHNIVGAEWTWQLHSMNHETGQVISRIYTTLHEVSIYKKEDWPALISFFKPRLISLDEFWSQAKYFFEALTKTS